METIDQSSKALMPSDVMDLAVEASVEIERSLQDTDDIDVDDTLVREFGSALRKSAAHKQESGHFFADPLYLQPMKSVYRSQTGANTEAELEDVSNFFQAKAKEFEAFGQLELTTDQKQKMVALCVSLYKLLARALDDDAASRFNGYKH